MKIIAMYLPQYHAIPENDEWWGKDFTEWRSVASAAPYFEGHYQPHVPHKSIGYYNLLDAKFIKKQHAMALRYGVSAFCYYYYNFSGKTLLEAPLRVISASTDISNEFCLCWANHDWTRAWYGQSKEVLIRQEYSHENAVRIFEGVKGYFANDRYITIDRKPLFLVFNPGDNPLMAKYNELWQYLARAEGYAGLFLAGMEALGDRIPPAVHGFDAAVEFAPDWACALEFARENRACVRKIDYRTVVANMISKPVPPYTRFRCVFPGWDNSPRYKGAATLFTDCSPGVFKYALEAAVNYTRKHLPENLHYVFINAWNEWGEGCHLEPDERYGFSSLNIVREICGGGCAASEA